MDQNQLLPAIVSLIIPGMGQLMQGRTQKGVQFLILWVLALFCVIIVIGIILVPVVHIWACINAAGWRPSDGVLKCLLLALCLAAATMGCGRRRITITPGPVTIDAERLPRGDAPQPPPEVY